MNALDFAKLLVVAAVLLAPGASRAADPAEGKGLAQQWCASCHAVVPGEATDKPAPSFESVVNERGRSDEWIATWLSTPHAMMPDLGLSRNQIDALVAYFDSLRKSN
jgi:mono/diheme cytochrome c family protein